MTDFLKYFDKLINITPRNEQSEVLSALNDNWDKYRYFIISAPPGVGKTHIALSIADQTKNSYILTSTKPLQEQYIAHSQDVVNLFGRPNYVCTVNNLFTADAAPCHADKKIKRDCIINSTCPYYSQRDKALNAKIFSTNYTYFLFANHCGPLKDQTDPDHERSVLIMDECHEVPGHLVGFSETKLNIDKFVTKYDLGDPDWRITEDAEENGRIIKVLYKVLENECNHLSDLMERQMNGDLDDITSAIVEKVQEIRTRHAELDRMLQRLKVYYKTKDEYEWIIKPIPEENSITLSPLYAAALFEEYLEHTAEKFVFMSATPGDKEVFAKELGIDPNEVCFIEVNTPFPPEKSPIIPLAVGKMGYNDIDNTIPVMTRCVNEMVQNIHPNEKGVIHASNYKIASAIFNAAPPDVKMRLIYRDMYGEDSQRLTNTQMLEMHAKSEAPTILLSPSMTTGIDLDGDLSRFQIITKLPFLSLGDPRTKRKSQIDSKWYRTEMWLTIAQAACRSTRSMEDHSTTYILDSSLEYFLRQDINNLPGWLLLRLLPNMIK